MSRKPSHIVAISACLQYLLKLDEFLRVFQAPLNVLRFFLCHFAGKQPLVLTWKDCKVRRVRVLGDGRKDKGILKK